MKHDITLLAYHSVFVIGTPSVSPQSALVFAHYKAPHLVSGIHQDSDSAERLSLLHHMGIES